MSRDTIHHRIRHTEITEQPTAQEFHVIGIDDWAYRRGGRYGTLICDVEHHRVVDVLSDRRVATVAAWLRRDPNIQIVSRDRAGQYADAIRQGLPHAQQVADRWHFLKNLSDFDLGRMNRHDRQLCSIYS
ncbi:MAG: ISL3 family transposase [Bacilli bacterium]